MAQSLSRGLLRESARAESTTVHDVFSTREIAAAAGITVEQVIELADSERISLLNGWAATADAVRLVRIGRAIQADRLPLRLVSTRARRTGTPMLASGLLHGLLAAVGLALSSMGLLSAKPADTVVAPIAPTRMVFLMAPGPGGGGGGGGLKLPTPPPVAQRKAPAPRPAVRPALPTRPVTPPARPVMRETPPPPVRPPAVEVPVTFDASGVRDVSGVLDPPPPSPAPPSPGPGSGGGAGTGRGTGAGEGTGSGLGAGSGGGMGGGPYRPGTGITPPTLLKEVRPLYTDEARRRALEGDVVLEIVVRRDGSVGDVRVLQTLGSGLEQRAIAAVRQWRFAPATRLGGPVDVLVEVAVGFTLR